MVHRLDIGAEAACHKPTDEGHQGLEKAEEDGQREHGATLVSTDNNTADHGHRKAVHGQR